jgi:enoyl-CoA hydratase/carnithine racemase
LTAADGRSALAFEEIGRLIELVDQASRDERLRMLILAGSGDFSAEPDYLEEMGDRLDPGGGGRAYRLLADQKTLCDKVRRLRIPTISIVRGLCAGRRRSGWRRSGSA